jgi:NADH:ubiquinone oxidoreductase subunit 5 (subunit L)/multisubunit Na+/H+ antiporter MnhA subunit
MVITGLVSGSIALLLAVAYSRWLDDVSVADLVLWVLILELGLAILGYGFLDTTDTTLVINFGSLSTPSPLPKMDLLFTFDELSAALWGVLATALIGCFYFLLEYFDFDAQGGYIALLSASFSQAALAYFGATDLWLIIGLWELISFISFLLVQFWTHRVCTVKAGLKVFCISQVGDLFFFCYLFLATQYLMSTSCLELEAIIPMLAFEYVNVGPTFVHLGTLMATCLTSAVFLKSAQTFFYPWLLDAMEAPVPISAQLHSSTLVIIGFYLFFRQKALFEIAPAVLEVFIWGGSLTVIGASVLAFFQHDGKRLLACSTASQLGYVVVGLGVRAWEEALLLLIFCCCNKAYTFVWFGALMQTHHGLSDFRMIPMHARSSWVAHAGIALAIANATVAPGAFAWHVKGLLTTSSPWDNTESVSWGLEVLQLTWFFSSLYLLSLYATLFLRPLRGPSSEAFNLSKKNHCGRLNVWFPSAHGPSFIAVMALLLLAIVTPSGWWGAYVSIEWLNTFPTLSYY